MADRKYNFIDTLKEKEANISKFKKRFVPRTSKTSPDKYDFEDEGSAWQQTWEEYKKAVEAEHKPSLGRALIAGTPIGGIVNNWNTATQPLDIWTKTGANAVLQPVREGTYNFKDQLNPVKALKRDVGTLKNIESYLPKGKEGKEHEAWESPKVSGRALANLIPVVGGGIAPFIKPEQGVQIKDIAEMAFPTPLDLIPFGKPISAGTKVGTKAIVKAGEEVAEATAKRIGFNSTKEMLAGEVGLMGHNVNAVPNVGTQIPNPVPAPQIVPTAPKVGIPVLSKTDDLLTKTQGETYKGVITKPIIKQIAGAVNPVGARGADQPEVVLKAMSGKWDDQITGSITAVMGQAQPKFARMKSALKIDADGIVRATDIKQKSPLPDGSQSMSIHDIIEYADRYDMPAKTREAVDGIRKTSKDLADMLEAEGILVRNPTQPLTAGQFHAKQGTSDWQFLHRVITTVKEEAADTLAGSVQGIVTKHNINFAKLPNETNYAYLARFVEDIKAGKVALNPDIEKLADDFANLADVKLKKQTINSHRNWETVAEGMKQGIKYSNDPLLELERQARGAYEAVKKARLTEAIPKLIKTTTPLERAEQEVGTTLVALTKQSDDADKLVEYVQRALRHESLPGASLNAIKTKFPQLSTRLTTATKLLPLQVNRLLKQIMSDVANTAKLSAKDAKGVSQRAKLQADLRLAFKPFGTQANITTDDIIDALSQTIKDKDVAVNAIKRTYQQLSNQQRMALKQVLDDAKALQAKASKELKDFKGVQSGYAEKMGSQGTNEYGRVQGVPGLSGRYIVSQDGRKGADLASDLADHFGYINNSNTVDKVVDAAGKLGAVMRMFRLGFDLSVTLIQNSMAIGYDIKNLVLYPINKAMGKDQGLSAVWAKSTKEAVESAFGKSLEHLENWIERPDIKPFAKDFIERGGLVETAESVEAATDIARLANKLPEGKVKNIMQFVRRQTMGRSEKAFTTGRVTAAINMYKAGFNAAKQAGKLDEWAKACNEMTGVLSSRGMGIGKSQRSLESAIGFMSPRFTRANAAIVTHILTNPKSYTSQEAASALIALIAASFGVYATVQSVQGKDVVVNPFDPNWGKMEIGDNKYYLGGIMSDIRRLLADIDSGVYQASGKHVSLSGKDDKTPLLITNEPNKSLLYSQFRSKTAPPTGAMIDFISGKDYNWETVTTTDTIKNWATPAWIDPATEGEGKLATGASFFGSSTAPINKTYDLSRGWSDDIKAYSEIPSNSVEFAVAKKANPQLLSREDYRERNPEIDAKLFVSGQVSTISTSQAYDLVLRLIQQNKIKPEEIKGIKAALAERDKLIEAGLPTPANTYTKKLAYTLAGYPVTGTTSGSTTGSTTGSTKWKSSNSFKSSTSRFIPSK